MSSAKLIDTNRRNRRSIESVQAAPGPALKPATSSASGARRGSLLATSEQAPAAESFRCAVPDDAQDLAELVDIAGEGLPKYLWRQMAAAGETAVDVGRQRACREQGAFSYRNALVCQAQGQIAAFLIGCGLEQPATTQDYADMPPMFVPLQQLEDLATGTWYVNVLAAYAPYQSQGDGSRLLESAESRARTQGFAGLSITVADSNAGARRLYQRFGFSERARRPMIKEAWKHPGLEWVLMLKAF